MHLHETNNGNRVRITNYARSIILPRVQCSHITKFINRFLMETHNMTEHVLIVEDDQIHLVSDFY
jgi:hypothetical protein